MKLYVVGHRDMPNSQRVVQACHAVAELLLNSKDLKGWDNGTVIVAGVVDYQALLQKEKEVREAGYETYAFHEPDMDDRATAFSFIGPDDLNLDLKLL